MSDAIEYNIFEEVSGAEGSGLNSNQDGQGEARPASSIPSLITVEDSDTTPRMLHNQRAPAYTLKAERPEHRAIIMMKASAMTNIQIAAAIGWTPAAICYVVKQPWAVEQILREIEQAGREPVMQLLRVSAMEAAETMLDVMRTADSKKTRLEAANSVMDRVFGKATNKIEVTNKDPNELSDAELAAIAKRDSKN